MLWFHKAHDTRNLNALMDCRLLCLTHCKAMFAWGNQSCGRLGLQEKKMEKALEFRCPQRTGCVENCLCQGLQSLVW